MGQIKPEVRDNHFQFYPEELDIIKPFVAGFYINWAKRYSFPDISVFLLNPENFMKESYGFSKQVLLAYSPYKNMETRTLDFVDKLIGSDELKEKGIETYCYILISDDPLIETWLQQNIERQDNRIIVPLNKDDDFFIRNILEEIYLIIDYL